MAIGILTSGGDAPGLNAVIRSIVFTGIQLHGLEFVGFRRGFLGLCEDDVMPLPRSAVMGIGKLAGTILRTSRANFLDHGGVERVREVLEKHTITTLIVIGGEGSLAGARDLHDAGLPVVGVPKTVDNDLGGTDYTFGFDTAVQVATESMDRLRSTGEAHERCMVAEVMGRNVGWIALYSGTAAGAHAILLPEQPLSLDEICGWVQLAHDRGRAPLVCVAEGFHLSDMEGALAGHGVDESGRPRLGGIGEHLAPLIQERTGIETRATTLGYIQRGGTPTAHDRVLATRFGIAALHAAHAGRHGTMVALKGTDIVEIPLHEALGTLKTVPLERYDEVRILFG